jgi:thiamine kinase-like enzyme
MYDSKLPGLRQAMNGEDMRVTLSNVFRRDPARGLPTLSSIRVNVLKHALGKRCVLEYWLEPDETHLNARRVVGKLYRKNRGEKIHGHLLNLWEATHRRSNNGIFFGMPEPLAYLPQLGMVLQSVVPGRQLSSYAEQDNLAAALPAVAENLATLHGLSVPSLEKRTMEDHIAKYCHPDPQVLAAACSEVAPLIEYLLESLRNDESLQRAALCPVHGDLGLDQIFIAAQRAFFIDFDGFCLSHSALDLGNFLVALRVHFGAKSTALTNIFLESYLASRSQRGAQLTGLRTYQVFAYLRRATICFRRKAVAGWRQQMQALLKAGYALLLEADRHEFSN